MLNLFNIVQRLRLYHTSIMSFSAKVVKSFQPFIGTQKILDNRYLVLNTHLILGVFIVISFMKCSQNRLRWWHWRICKFSLSTFSILTQIITKLCQKLLLIHVLIDRWIVYKGIFLTFLIPSPPLFQCIWLFSELHGKANLTKK